MVVEGLDDGGGHLRKTAACRCSAACGCGIRTVLCTGCRAATVCRDGRSGSGVDADWWWVVYWVCVVVVWSEFPEKQRVRGWLRITHTYKQQPPCPPSSPFGAPPTQWLAYSLVRHRRDVRHQHLVDERSEAQPKVGRDVLHCLGKRVAQHGQRLLVVLHGLGEVHQVVQIDWVVLGLRVGHVQLVLLVWGGGERMRAS